jgi:hypothetical protein
LVEAVLLQAAFFIAFNNLQEGVREAETSPPRKEGASAIGRSVAFDSFDVAPQVCLYGPDRIAANQSIKCKPLLSHDGQHLGGSDLLGR